MTCFDRDPKEVSILMGIFAKYAESLKKEALSRNIKVLVLSTDDSKLPTSGMYDFLLPLSHISSPITIYLPSRVFNGM